MRHWKPPVLMFIRKLSWVRGAAGEQNGLGVATVNPRPAPLPGRRRMGQHRPGTPARDAPEFTQRLPGPTRPTRPSGPATGGLIIPAFPGVLTEFG